MQLFAAILAVAVGQPSLPTRPVVDSAAMESARRELIGAVLDIPLASDATIGALAGWQDAREMIREARVTAGPVRYAGGVHELHLTLDSAALVDAFGAWLIRRRFPADQCAALVGRVRAQELSTRLTVAGFSQHERSRRPVANDRAPAPSSEELATDAARLGAARLLVDELGHLRLRDGSRLNHLFSLRPDLEAWLVREVCDAVCLGPRRVVGGGVVVEAGITPEAALRLIRHRLSAGPPTGAEQIDADGLRAGEGSPRRLAVHCEGRPPSWGVLRALGVSPEFARPDWSRRCLIVRGEATAGDGPDDSPHASAAADFDARRRIAEQIDGLPWIAGKTVADAIVSGRIDPQDLKAWLYSAPALPDSSAAAGDQRIVVTVRIPLRGLYRLLSIESPGTAEAIP